jgi:hypothetical protein
MTIGDAPVANAAFLVDAAPFCEGRALLSVSVAPALRAAQRKEVSDRTKIIGEEASLPRPTTQPSTGRALFVADVAGTE